MICPYAYNSGSVFMGNELNYWCEEQISNHTNYEEIARDIYLHNTFRDYATYIMIKSGSIGLCFKRIYH